MNYKRFDIRHTPITRTTETSFDYIFCKPKILFYESHKNNDTLFPIFMIRQAENWIYKEFGELIFKSDTEFVLTTHILKSEYSYYGKDFDIKSEYKLVQTPQAILDFYKKEQ